MQVAMFHCLSVMADYPTHEPLMQPALVLFNGSAAVSLFFVLSGFVLGLSLRKSHGSFGGVYLRYAVRWAFRIYPTIFVSTLVISVMIFGWHAPVTANRFIDLWFPRHVTVRSVVEQLAFIRNINPVTWTLRMELVGSLLLPFALLIERWRGMLLPWLLLGLVGLTFAFPTVLSVVVMPAFLVGFVLPSSYGWWRRMQPHMVFNLALLVGGILSILLPRSLHWRLPVVTILESAGAFIVIGTLVYGAGLPVFKILDHHLIKVAGQVSYSYYVYHPICLFGAAHLLLRCLPAPFLAGHSLFASALLWLLSSAVAFPLAWVCYRLIEQPFIRYAKLVYGRSRPGEAAA